MATIITREVGGTAKNSPLTNAELDNNFINLDDAIENLQVPASITSAGLMSASDKAKLDGVEAGAQVNTVASVAGKTGAVTLVTADVGGLGTALAGKASLVHTHSISDVTNLQSALDDKQATSSNLVAWSGKPAPSGAIVDTSSAQTLSSKTLTNPVINNYARFTSEFNAGNSGTAVTLNFANGQKQRLTLTGNATITLSFPGVGNYQVLCVQDTTGGRTPAGFSGVTGRFLGSATMPAFNTAASGESIMSIYYNGSIAYIAVSKVGA